MAHLPTFVASFNWKKSGFIQFLMSATWMIWSQVPDSGPMPLFTVYYLLAIYYHSPLSLTPPSSYSKCITLSAVTIANCFLPVNLIHSWGPKAVTTALGDVTIDNKHSGSKTEPDGIWPSFAFRSNIYNISLFIYRVFSEDIWSQIVD